MSPSPHPYPPPAVQWEQKSLAQHLKWNFTDEQRDQLMKVRGGRTEGRAILNTARTLTHQVEAISS